MAETLSMFDEPRARGSAVLSPCGHYRYRLERRLPSGNRTMSVTMLNPSTADAALDDPTIRKLLGFADRLGVGRVIVTNLAAFRTTDPRGLRDVKDPIGPENDEHIVAAVAEADLVIAAWGAHVAGLPGFSDRAEHVTRLLAREGEVWCWGTANSGQPRHPLMLSYSTPLEVWSP